MLKRRLCSSLSRHGVVALSLCASACVSRGSVPPGAVSPEAAAPPVVGNPFVGVTVYGAPYSNAENAQKLAEKTNPADAASIGKIASQPQAGWYGSWSGNIETAARNYVNAADRAGQVPLMVAYNVPNRDCGQYSAGGATDAEAYLTWVAALASGVGERRAVVVLEPDAVPLLKQCLSEADQKGRLDMLRAAVELLEARPGVSVYIDAGHSNWVPAAEMAERLKLAGIEKARGFSLNVSNFEADDALIQYGKDVVAALGMETHFIIDSSRNGNGPAPAGDEPWCNPEGRALGRPPSADTGEPLLDAFLWIKRPGESDGECKGGPPAGQWFQARALEMARNAHW